MANTSIDVDIGGTFTDCLVYREGKPYTVKVPTTGYRLAIGFMKALREAAALIEVSTEELLEETEIIRYSTTIAVNTLIQRKGPRLGLITTEGAEDTTIIALASQWLDGLTFRERREVYKAIKPEPIIERDMIIGVKERINCFGKVVRPLDEDNFREKLSALVNRGARGFVVCLLWSQANPAHERLIKEIIEEEYRDCYLGSMPVILSTEVLPKRNEYQRSMGTILSAYLHGSMVEELSGMGDELRDLGYNRPLMMVHNSGGMAKVFRTFALQTYNGGPVAGLMGSSYLASLLGYDSVVTTDMGGTSFDLGLLLEGSPRFYAFQPVVERFMVDFTMLEIKCIGAGGGSIAWLNPAIKDRLEVGPQGAGSMPGPAAYDMGGREPTVTDADLVLGYINGDYYHGGRLRLNRDRSIETIRDRIAKPLGMEVEEAALAIKKVVDGKMGSAVFTETVLRGFQPSEFVLFAFGGAGPTHCCGYTSTAGVPKIIIPPLSPVFCAFGSGNMDIVHIYEKYGRILLVEPMTKQYFSDFGQFNDIIGELTKTALEELRTEQLPTDNVVFSLELDMKFGGLLNVLRVHSPRLTLQNETDVKAIYDAFAQEYAKVYSPFAIIPEAGVELVNFVFKATVPRAKLEVPSYALRGEIPSRDALKGKRQMYWDEYSGFRETNVYEQERLEPGNIIDGPGVVEAKDTTVVLPPGNKLTVNKYRCFVIDRL
jgi:N-methylhydantoinase A/acetophenone carboxylase